MTQKTTAALLTEADANIDTNGANLITGALLNTMLENIIDSMVNKSSDPLELASAVYRCGTKAVTAAQVTITFSSALANANYQVFITDNDGVGWSGITTKTTTTFKITGLSTGTIAWAVFLDL